MVNEVKVRGEGIGLNVATDEYEDMIEAGIIDPAMVTRSALQNAASIAKNILTTEVIVADKPEKNGGGGMGGGMGRHGRHGRHDVATTNSSEGPKSRALEGAVTGAT